MLSIDKLPLTIKKVISPFVFRMISKIGLYSYSIYVWHLLVKYYSMYVMHTYFTKLNQSIYFLIYFVLSLGIGILLSKIIEQPLLRLRDHLVPRQPKSV